MRAVVKVTDPDGTLSTDEDGSHHMQVHFKVQDYVYRGRYREYGNHEELDFPKLDVHMWTGAGRVVFEFFDPKHDTYKVLVYNDIDGLRELDSSEWHDMRDHPARRGWGKSHYRGN